MVRKSLSMLLILATVCSLFGVSAFATTQYTDWSAWSTTAVSATSTRQVETRQVAVSYNMEVYCCGNSKGYRCYLRYMQSGYTLRLHSTFSARKSDVDSWEQWGQGSYFTYASNVNGYIIGPGTAYIDPWNHTPSFIVGTNYETQYRYRDRIVDVNECSISLSSTSYTYDGSAKKPAVTVKFNSKTLVNGTDYSLSYANNVDVGTASVKITGKGLYSGSVTKYFTIKEPPKTDVATCTMTLDQTAFIYDGAAKNPTVTVKNGNEKLTAGTDYTLSYANNVKVGTATATITGIGKYTGTKSANFSIALQPTSISSIGLDVNAAFVLTWAKVNGIDGYQIQCADNTNFSNAKTVTAKASATSMKYNSALKNKQSYSFRIRTYKKFDGKNYFSAWSTAVKETFAYPKTVVFAATRYAYTGKVITPKVTVKDSAGNVIAAKYYKVTYAGGRKAVGRYAVKVAFSGKYSGTITSYFDIVPKATKLTFISSPAKAQFAIKWNKVAGVSGYQIQTAPISNFKKNIKTYIAKAASTSALFRSGIQSKQIYFVRIRSYRTVKYAGKNVVLYSAWSTIGAVKTK
ncbi:MAG: hypothetical protein IJJ41_06270 [Clostridia bacterium]|nr:hypothetical protein [Clostridia bacterium]